ncbi:MarR family winged helix-turn-helix transcriptional regulator [Notoacmeibacter sp. MSK16QG-6]|uniref:MarR family winged helix-turn-helix transcriptional regulator n=1 Tax=Notoacmeibacter sp. MSK16QG-6 TaxID=2957982 RepID=UPI00209C8917|nr:MarR family transcriptional regulator [Notoacmeibacter sp. MSK16QG-6]MCP1199290.1 MarR family transcriptional regulator [Notoacmeibacter sp. MSK16QG-6]
MFDKHYSAGYLASHMARLFAIALQRQIAPLDLAPAQFMTLLELWEEDGLTQVELVKRLDVEQATMANTLKRMARDGLIEPKPHPKDNRARQIWLTERGRELREAATDAASVVNETALAGLTQWERTALIELMRNTIANLQKAQRP